MDQKLGSNKRCFFFFSPLFRFASVFLCFFFSLSSLSFSFAFFSRLFSSFCFLLLLFFFVSYALFSLPYVPPLLVFFSPLVHGISLAFIGQRKPYGGNGRLVIWKQRDNSHKTCPIIGAIWRFCCKMYLSFYY